MFQLEPVIVILIPGILLASYKYQCNQDVILFFFCLKTSAVQVSPSEVLVECHSTGLVHTIKTDIHISGIFVTKVC